MGGGGENKAHIFLLGPNRKITDDAAANSSDYDSGHHCRSQRKVTALASGAGRRQCGRPPCPLQIYFCPLFLHFREGPARGYAGHPTNATAIKPTTTPNMTWSSSYVLQRQQVAVSNLNGCRQHYCALAADNSRGY